MAHSEKTMTFATNLVPQEDNIYNLGNSSQRWKINGITPGNARVFYGTCDTAAGTVLKEVICAQYDKVLTIGDMIIVKFSITNTGAVGSLQLTIKKSTTDTAGTTAKNIKRQYNGTGANNLVSTAELNKDSISVFIYNGTYWILTNADYNNTYSYMRPYESTAKGSYSSINLNPAKTAAAGWRFQLSAGKYFMYSHYYDNQAQSALTLNIGSTGAKPIYINGAASSSSNYTLPGGQYLVYYDGTNYYFRTDDKMTGNITGNAATASKTTAANLTTTANAIAYYTDTTGTLGTKASANGALYATSANGALQWGTLPIAQGGTGKTTANDAANILISGLPAWTANPTDDTYLIRRDTGGTATYGQVKFSTVWNYIKGKADSVYAAKATTLSGYGITDAKIASGTITLGNNTISPVTAINWDSTNKKLTRTINGADADVVTAAALRTDLGLSNALHFIGVTSTTLADSSTTSTLTAKSTGSLTKTTDFVDGDVVMDGDQLREYVWSGSAWRLLGITTSTAYTQPASTATNTWIAQISQGTDGKITATTGSLNTSGTWSGNATTATTATNLANNPSIQTSGTTQVTITAGGKTSSAYTIPYATSAGSATSATTATYIKCTDTRNTALNPTDLTAAQGIRFDFKAKGTINLTATDTYAGVMSFRPYASNTDWSGGNAHQLAFNSEGLHWRNGGASWGDWYQILDSSNTTTGTNNNATLTWNTTYTIAKINGTDIKFTTMTKPTYTASDVGLGNVENTKLSTWTGSTNITTLGTITTGTWNGTAIANNKLANSSLTVGNKSISLGASGTIDEIITYSTTIGQNTSWDITNSGAYPAYYSGGFSGDQNPSTNQNAPYSYGTLYVMRANTAGAAQFYISHHASSSKNAANGIRYRSGWDVANTEKTVAQRWEAWATILDDKNYNLYSPKLDGTGATGSWGISITGNADTATKFNSTRKIELTGAVTGSATTDGSSGWTISTTVNHNHDNRYSIASGVITLGSNTITPVTSVNGHSGSSVSVTASDLGLASALKYVGTKSSLPTATDSTTYSTYNNGDVITVSAKEYAYVKGSNAAGSSWVELGDEGSYKLKQTAFTNSTGTADGTNTSTAFIYSFSQDENGAISNIKTRQLPTLTNVSFTAATDNNEYPILLKNSTGSDTTAAGVKFANTTNKMTTINPSTGMITAPSLTLASNAATAHLAFSRAGWNYVTMPNNDSSVISIGYGTPADNTTQRLVIYKTGTVRPGANGSQNLGDDTHKWNKVYGVNFYGTFNGTATSAQQLAAREIDNSDLNQFSSGGALKYAWVGGGNSILSKPTDVNAFGIIAMKTATSWTGQLLMSTDSEPGLYWRTNLTTETPSYGSWTPLANGNGSVYYGTCETAANVAEKAVICKHYHTLKAGDIIVVTFTNANTEAQPKLNVNNTGAVGVKMAYSGGIVDLGSTTQLSYTCTFIYDGTYWLIINQQNTIQLATASNQTNWRSILLSNSNSGDENFTPSANTLGRTYAAHNVKYQPSTGTLRAPIMKTPKVQIEFNHVNKAHIEWNDTDSSIDFIFD